MKWKLILKQKCIFDPSQIIALRIIFKILNPSYRVLRAYRCQKWTLELRRVLSFWLASFFDFFISRRNKLRRPRNPRVAKPTLTTITSQLTCRLWTASNCRKVRWTVPSKLLWPSPPTALWLTSTPLGRLVFQLLRIPPALSNATPQPSPTSDTSGNCHAEASSLVVLPGIWITIG